MKILIITNSSIGLAKFRKELIEKLKTNHEIYIATPYDECAKEVEEMTSKVIEVCMDRRGINLKQEWRLFRRYYTIVKTIRPDFLITYTIKPNIYGGIVARISKIPYVVNITGLGTAFQAEGWLKKVIIMLYRMALKKARVVFFENHGNKQVFIENKIIKQEKCCVLTGAGVNLQEFSYREYPKENRVNFLFMGRLMKEKGIDELFEAIECLHKENNHVFLTVLGGYEENYSKKIQELSSKGILNYIGWVSDVRPYIEKSMCSVLPSYHEGMSNTLLECAAMGRPIIASNIPGCKETFIEGLSGYGVKIKDSFDLYKKMKKFSELKYREKEEMGKAARRHMEKYFDKKEVVRITMERMEIE